MDHNGHGIIDLYGVVMIRMGSLHADGQSNLGYLSLVHRVSSPEVACWTSDHWVAGSNPLRGMFHH